MDGRIPWPIFEPEALLSYDTLDCWWGGLTTLATSVFFAELSFSISDYLVSSSFCYCSGTLLSSTSDDYLLNPPPIRVFYLLCPPIFVSCFFIGLPLVNEAFWLSSNFFGSATTGFSRVSYFLRPPPIRVSYFLSPPPILVDYFWRLSLPVYYLVIITSDFWH